MMLEDAIKLAKELGLESEDLDDEVNEIKAEEASGINNDGLGAQISFIMDELGDAFDKNYLKEIAEEKGQ